MFSVVADIAPRSPCQVLTAEIPQIRAVLMLREPTSIRPLYTGPRAAAVAVARARPPLELIRTARHGAAGRQHMSSIGGQTRRQRLWSIASGRRQSDHEGGVGSDQMLNVEGGASGEC
jgi:hypothetical protein